MEPFIIKIFRRLTIFFVGLSLLAPLILHSGFLFPYITPKTLYFRMMIEVALFCYLVLVMIAPAYRPDWRHWVVRSVTAYVIIETLASLVGIGFYKSLWGTIERGEGLLLLYHLYALFLMCSSVLRDRSSWFRVLHIQSLVTFGVSLYAWAQYFSWEKLLWWTVVQPGASRVSGTIGNASFFAAMIVFGIFTAILFLVIDRRWWMRTVYGIVLIMNSAMLYLTQTRGSILALLGGLFLLGVLLQVFRGSKRWRMVFFWIGSFGVICIVSLFVFKNTALVQNNRTLYRIATISRGDITTESRILAWKASWQGFLDRPVLGYGYEHYNVAYNRYFPAAVFRDSGSQIWFDRAHNTVFDVLITGGILGLLAYAAIFLSIFGGVFRTVKHLPQGTSRSDSVLVLSLVVALLAAHFFQDLFVFDVLATYLWMYFWFAFAVFLTPSREPAEARTSLSVPQLSKSFQTVFTLVLLVGLISGVYGFAVRPGIAARRVIDGFIYDRNGKNPAKAMNTIKEAIDMRTNYTTEFRQKLADLAVGYAHRQDIPSSNKQVYLSLAIREIKKNIEENPRDAQNFLYLLNMDNLYDAYDPESINEIYSTAARAIELSPTRPQIYFELGQAAITQKKFDDAIQYFQKAVSLNPEPIESHWNLASALEIAGRVTEAEAEYAWLKGRGYNPDSPANLRRRVPVYVEAKNYEKLKTVLEKLVADADTGNANTWAQLAAVYRELKEFDHAIGALEKAVALDPNLKNEADRFLQEIEAQQKSKSAHP